MEGIYALGGSRTRTPGRYCAYNPTNGKPTNDPLLDTHEYIHPSVRSRLKLHGPGLDDKGEYTCEALRNFKLVIEWPEDGGGGGGGAKRPNVFWRARDRPADPAFVKALPEAPLWNLEMELLRYDPETEQYVMKPSGVRARREKRGKSRNQSRRGETLSPAPR